MKLSVCLIARDEEEVIARCLECVKQFADEIVVVDTGSKDRTKLIASQYTTNVFDFEWQKDFSAARNFAFSKATCDYIMWLDADDIILKEDINKINKLKEQMSEDVYVFYYVQTYDENFAPISIFKRERIVKRQRNFRWVGAVHEYLQVDGLVKTEDIKVYHKKEKINKKNRNLSIYLAQKRKKIPFSPRDQFFYAREYYFLGRYSEAIKQLRRYLNMPGGWQINRAQACMDAADCYDILGQPEQALEMLGKSLVCAKPQAEVFCKMGEILIRLNRFDEAIFWLERAMECKIDLDSGAFVDEDAYKFRPALYLCYAHFVKGDVNKAYEYHKICLECKPKDPRTAQNQKFFDNYFEKNKI